MTATGHAAVGVALAAAIPNPIIGVPVAILSHIVCDLFPHWDSGTAKRMGRKKSKQRFFKEAVIDLLLSIVVTFLIARYIFTNVTMEYAFLMAFSAQFLDYFSMAYYILHFTFWPFKLIFNWQSAWNRTLDAPWGIINQVAFCVLLVVLAKFNFLQLLK